MESPVTRPAGEGRGRNPSMHASEQSDRHIGPGKPSNKDLSITQAVTADLRRWWRKGGLAEGNLRESNNRFTQWKGVR
jgi:hypothetical protein